jgi:O-antigen ligase
MEGPRAGSPAWWRQDARWLAFAGPVLVFTGHVLYGAMLPQTALSLAFAGALLLAACLCTPQVRRELSRLRQLTWPMALFATTVLIALWTMTPWIPGGPHPVWAYAGISPGAGTLDKSQTLLEIIKLLGLACLFGVGLAAGASDVRARLSVNVSLALGAALGFWSFLSFAGGALGPGVRRLGSTFESPNTAATLFAVLLMLAIGAALSRARTAPKQWAFSRSAPWLGAGLIFAVCLLATASRGGFTAAATGLIAFGVLEVARGRVKLTRATIAVAAALLAGAALLALAGKELIDRFMGMPVEADSRRQLFEAHWQVFQAAPLMGNGLGSFDTVNRLLLDAGNVGEFWSVRAAHNVYLNWLEQAGLVGALPMFGCLAALLLLTLRNTLRRSRMTGVLAGLLAADVVILAHGMTDFALETYSLSAFWAFLLGLQFSAAQGTSRR